MYRNLNAFIALLVVVAALDVTSATLMPGVNGSARPPEPAIVATWLFAGLTLAAAVGLTRGAKWSRPILYVTCTLRVISALLGIGDNPGTAVVTVGTIGAVLSIVVLALLVRSRNEAGATSPELV